jgi:hypothetical protein
MLEQDQAVREILLSRSQPEFIRNSGDLSTVTGSGLNATIESSPSDATEIKTYILIIY